ncbi:MAG: PDZ domain-containing protein [Candidatus Zixiibacteriota bacterium]
MRNIAALLSVLVLLALTLNAEEARLLRFPTVNGNQVAFSYGGDIYVAARTGGQATRLTSHEGLEMFPRFSPDGKHIAFTGQYDGDFSVYVIPVAGGEPKRLTYHPGLQNTSERFGPENVVMGWSKAGDKVLYRSRKESMNWWDGRAYLVSVASGMSEPLPMATAGFTSLSPDGKKVAYCPVYRDFRTWKRYKGGMAQDVWIFDLTTYANQKITDWEGTDNMPMWFGERIYFNSDRTGRLNLYCYEMNSGQTRQVTNYTDYDVRWPSLGDNGIVFESGGFLYVMDLPSEEIHKIEISLITDRNTVRTEFQNVSECVTDFDISPDGKRAVFAARGDIFTVPAKEGNTRNLTLSSSANDMNPVWSPDGKWVAYISDKSGEDEFYITSQDGKESVQLITGGDSHRYGAVWSPDSKKLAFSDKSLRLYVVAVATKQTVQIDKATRNEIRDMAWSPDSRFLAYSKVLDNGIRTIFTFAFDNNTLHQLTPSWTNDYGPAFDPNGQYLYFISERNFNPVLGAYEFEYINTSIDDLYLIVLNADSLSPFRPKSDEVEVKVDTAKKMSDKGKTGKEGEDKPKTGPVKVKVDFDGIYERQVAIDLPAGNYNGLMAVPGGIFYLGNPVRGMVGNIGQPDRILNKYDIAKKKNFAFLSGIESYALSADQKNLLIKKDNNFYVVSAEGEKADLEDKKLDLSRMEMKVDHESEFSQMFNQVWRRYRDYFYDEHMHGVDWQKMHDKYAPLIPYVINRYDFTYVLGEMVGELCCSHTYVGGGEKPKVPSSDIGLLGVDFAVDPASKRLRLAHILEGENWDPELRSPLRDPGIEVKEGDYLLAINGQELTADIDPYSLTEHTVGKQMTLTLNSSPGLKGAREVTVKPIASEENLRYFNWVEKNRKYVDSVSHGQIGYLHIPDMGSYGLVRFAKMYFGQLRKPGLIIDVRYNGGGFVSGLVLERLRREVVGMGYSRNFAAGPDPGDAPYAHMITLMNQFSTSDGDIFPYCFREYKLGPLMGKRTWGGVVGIRGMDELIDGGYYTVPEFSTYNMKSQWVMENVGVSPDMEVDNLPDREARGSDDQLDRAIQYVAEKLKSEPKTLPPPPGPPTPR